MTEKVYVVYHIECGIMQDISVYRDQESAEQYYQDLIRANYPDDAEDIISGEQGQEGDHTIDWNGSEVKE
jgi:hypothetical protein